MVMKVKWLFEEREHNYWKALLKLAFNLRYINIRQE